MGQPTDADLDRSVAAMLRIGTSVSALVVLAGGLLALRHPFNTAGEYRHFQAASPTLYSVKAIVQGAMHLSPASIIQLGIVLLIATPVARVALCVIGFARQHSWLYVGISSLVLTILLYSLLRT